MSVAWPCRSPRLNFFAVDFEPSSIHSRDLEGWSVYEAALRRAASDTAHVLWRQVRSIATPQERALYPRTAPAAREAFLRFFWAGREPDLRTSLNERLGEHFRRMAEAQHDYRVVLARRVRAGAPGA